MKGNSENISIVLKKICTLLKWDKDCLCEQILRKNKFIEKKLLKTIKKYKIKNWIQIMVPN